MQFVADGPDIPEALLQAHEEGRVVFFCGAGISLPAGLPSFQGLVRRIYKIVGTDRTDIEDTAYRQHQFDATLDLLEHRLGRRHVMRNALAEALKPKPRRGATDTHQALLQLARCRNGALHLVTTNFDRIFSNLTATGGSAVPSYEAPFLPIPKSSRWNGIVYLHGLLPEEPDDRALNRLVLTSGDFGLAYLTERWAARFITELFRNYTVCFVGYSISDPVLRYMMDALAADRMLGETAPQPYAFGECTPGQQEKSKKAWDARGVVPILYRNSDKHSALHRTLKEWGAQYRDGVLGKEHMVEKCAIYRPSVSSQDDDFVGRMMWALSDPSGLPAKRFADFDRAPSLEWLEALSKPTLSLIRQTHGSDEVQWDDVMVHLGRWLVRHLDDPALILWLAKRGGHLHPRLASQIERQLDELAKWEREGRQDELARIRTRSPNAIPRKVLRPVWRLFLAGRLKSQRYSPGLHLWKARLKHEGLSATLRYELRELLAPRVTLQEPLHLPKDHLETETPKRLNQLVRWEMVLAADHVHSSLPKREGDEDWHHALPELFDDLQQVLRDALDLRQELGAGSDGDFELLWKVPSISAHSQNRSPHEWVVLIEIVRDAWMAIRDRDRDRASQLARAWFSAGYPTLKRLALFAASQDGCLEPDEWVDWLLADNATWLWAFEVRRETLRLLVLRGHHVSPELRGRLESAILAGPPRAPAPDDLSPEDWQWRLDHSVWLYLAKLQSSGVQLGKAAAEGLTLLATANPAWHLAEDERDEFPVWRGGVRHRDHDQSGKEDLSQLTRGELAERLKQPKPQGASYQDNWQENCRTRFSTSVRALFYLARQGIWPERRWGEALSAWSVEGLVSRSWRVLAKRSRSMPDEVLQKIAGDASWWLEAVSRSVDGHEDVLLDLCRRLLACQYKDPDE